MIELLGTRKAAGILILIACFAWLFVMGASIIGLKMTAVAFLNAVAIAVLVKLAFHLIEHD